MDISSKRETFITRCAAKLARDAGFHPVEMALPRLTPYRTFAEQVLARPLPDGYWQMILLMGCDTPRDLAEAAERVVTFAREHPELTTDIRLRISCVGVGPGGLSRTACRRLLGPVRMHQRHVVVRRFWVALDRRRMFAFYSPWTFAPAFEINPCDPDDNLFVTLLRRDRYLTEDVGPEPTEDFHRLSLARDRTFLSGLLGRKTLVRALIALNVLVWLVLEFSGGSTQPGLLIRAGAKTNGLIQAGQYWRLVTPIFLHFGLAHLVLNLLGLLFLGEVLERIYGTMQFVLLYFVSGIVSVVASVFFGGELMVGASGAIFGLAGALVVYGWRYRSRIPRRYGAMFGSGLLPLIGLNILLGAVMKGIDNSAHVGGLIAGTIVTLTLTPLADQTVTPSWTSPRRLVTLVVLGVVLGAVVVAGTSYVQFDAYGTDARWTVRREVPGGLTVRVPGSWVPVPRTDAEVVFQSVCYEGRLEARAIPLPELPHQTFLDEMARIRRSGFQVVGDTGLLTASLLNDLVARGRVQALMQDTRARQRQQVFILLPGKLISIGVEVPQKAAARFAPVLDRILAPLPEPQEP